MKKILTIAWKDLLLAFRDPASLMIMLATPLLLTLVMAFAFGGSGGGDTPLENIPVVIVNQDDGEMGKIFIDVFQSEDVADLVEPVLETDPTRARELVDSGSYTAAVIIPAGLSDQAFPWTVTDGQITANDDTTDIPTIEVYSDPTKTISTGVVRAIVDQILAAVTSTKVTTELSIEGLIAEGILSPAQAGSMGNILGQRFGEQARTAQPIILSIRTQSGAEATGFDWFAYIAPSMAILFLMFTMANGGRTLLAERDWGTLPRMLVTPTSVGQVLSGKILGIFLTGLVQMIILYVANRLMFNISWGEPVAVLALIGALSAAATSWGILIAAYSRTTGQAGMLGNMVSLIFGALAGNFLPRANLPLWVQQLGFITPNAWGIEAFGELARSGTIADISVHLLALAGMTIILFGLALIAFRRQYST